MAYRTAYALLALSLVAGTVGAMAAANAKSATLDKIRSSGKFSIGYREASIPFSYLGNDQKPVGLSLDLCAAVVAKVKSDLKLDRLDIAYVPVTASNRIPLLQNGTIDIECGSTTNTADRGKQVAFSLTIYVSQPKWLVAAPDIADAKALTGKTVVVTQGSLSLPVAVKINATDKLGLDILQAKEHGESLLMVRTNRAAAWFEEDVLLAGLRATSPDPGALRILPDGYGTYFEDALMLSRSTIPSSRRSSTASSRLA